MGASPSLQVCKGLEFNNQLLLSCLRLPITVWKIRAVISVAPASEQSAVLLDREQIMRLLAVLCMGTFFPAGGAGGWCCWLLVFFSVWGGRTRMAAGTASKGRCRFCNWWEGCHFTETWGTQRLKKDLREHFNSQWIMKYEESFMRMHLTSLGVP